MVVKEQREPVVLTHKGQKIFGVLHLPKGAQKVPAVLICHGFAGHKVGKYRVYVALAEMLAQRGIAVLRFDFRGTGDSEGELEEMTLEEEITDAQLALQFLQNHDAVDSKKIGFYGRSLGAAIATRLASRSGQAKGIALWAAVFSGKPWREKWEQLQDAHLDDDKKRELMQMNGQMASDAFYQELFHLNIEEDLKKLNDVPMLMIHSEKDELVTIDHMDEYLRCRRGAKATTSAIRLHKCNHDFFDFHEREMALQKTAEWFEKILK